jgi:biopolymer transport protein ExbB
VIPPALVAAINELANQPGGFDPQRAYQLCQQHPSTAANVLRAVLLKVGRPSSELEHTMKETSEREAARLYKNVRPITLAVSITPLLGLLGTVQGMIECFYRTANLAASANKTQELANGIYVALVTTFGGLVVAIPAAVIAHYLEGRIQAYFYEIDELLLSLMPRLEPFEGKIRVTQ